MIGSSLGIGGLAAITGVKAPTIRFYEQIGLLQPPARTTGRQRRYGSQAVKRLSFIRHARELGFEIDEIRALLALADRPEASCDAVAAIAREHVAHIDAKMKRLRAMRRELAAVIGACHGPHVCDCRIIEALSEPAAGRRTAEM
jgi:Cu(I)-responsive transcriptional regulator